MNETTAITKRPVIDAIVENKAKFGARLPAGMDAEKFTLGITTAIQKNPDLLACDPKSVILAAYDAAELGISLSPSLALGWLIPYKTQCQFQVSYRGLVQKARETKEVKSFFAEVVYEGDKFERQFAPKRNLFHAPGDKEYERVKEFAVGAYAFIEFIDGSVDWEYLTAEQIERRRKHSKNPNSLMWATFWEEGWRKTPIRVLWKRLPLSNQSMERLAEHISKEAEADTEPEPAGRLELEKDEVLTLPLGTGVALREPVTGPGDMFTGPEKATIPPSVKPISIFYHVGKEITMVKGDVKKIVDRLPQVGAKFSKADGVWAMPAGRTHELVELMQSAEITFVETDENGAVLSELPQEKISADDDFPGEPPPDEKPKKGSGAGIYVAESQAGEKMICSSCGASYVLGQYRKHKCFKAAKTLENSGDRFKNLKKEQTLAWKKNDGWPVIRQTRRRKGKPSAAGTSKRGKT